MTSAGWGDVDPLQVEDHRSDRLLSDFLGLRDGLLCPVFGFDRNAAYMLAVQVLCGFIVLKLCAALSDTLLGSGRPEDGEEEKLPHTPQDGRVAPHHSPEMRSHMARSPFATLDSLGAGAIAGASDSISPMRSPDPLASAQAHGRSRAQVHLATSASDDHDGAPRAMEQEIAALNEEFQQRLAKILEERRQQEQHAMKKSDQETLLSQDLSRLDVSQMEGGGAGAQQGGGSGHDFPILPIVYWVWQITMSVILLVAMVVSMTQNNSAWTELMQSRGTWSHYNLFVFAFLNSGMLPTGVQAVFYIISALFPPTGRDDSARFLQLGSGEGVVESATSGSVEAHRRLLMLMIPMLLPLAALSLTHVVPFCVCYPWVAVLAGLLTISLFMLVKFAAQTAGLAPKLESDAAMLVLQVLVCLFVHCSVPVMIRVFGGEWRHGGYSNQLFSRVFRGEFEREDCTWFSFSRGVDAVLRWT